uniref:Tetratricopeptide SHNi-TPR domain-containing protein n=1 Tax=Psilocybe cubensis TaxID=181762 RepID=A0A8H7XRK9_PSICU
MSSSTKTNASESTSATVTVESSVEHAKRAFALKKYEQAIDHYATALELATKQLGEDAPEVADLYFAYGKALLENAIAQSTVLGKEQPEEAIEEQNKASGSGSNKNGPILSFSGDADDAGDDEDHPIDLFGKAAAGQDEEEEEEGDEEDDGEPEDDFNAAWEVLDLARAIYDKQKNDEDDDEVKLKLADTYIALGDVSLETEKFDQAISDYEAGLELKVALLPGSSRQIAEAHYKLSMVLDLTSGRLSDAIAHAEKAQQSVEDRLVELKNGLAGTLPPLPEETLDSKGKGKSSQKRLIRDDYVQKMTTSHIESEIKELSGLRDDLALKVEELKTSPNESLSASAPALAAQQLDRELNGTSSSSAPIVVNDLSSMVKKKKKAPVEDVAATKRKAESEPEPLNVDKKARLEEPSS